MHVIEATTVHKAWLEGAKHLQGTKDWSTFNLVLNIQNPTEVTGDDQKIEKEIDLLLKKTDKSLQTVADTIFPAWYYVHHKAKGVYEMYPDEVYPKIKRLNKWGTYAYRMVRQQTEDDTINPLKEIVTRLKKEMKKGKKRAAYELSLTDLSQEIAIHNNELDSKWPIGGPCLSHLSFKLDPVQKKIHLAVMYRSHYYIERVLGNLIGLARLQSFVAREVGMGIEPGELLCVSTYAKLDLKPGVWKKNDIDKLLKKFK